MTALDPKQTFMSPRW